MTHLYILAVLCFIVAASEWLVRRTRLRVAGSALLVIVVTAVVANLGGLPISAAAADPVSVYEVILGDGALLAVFWLLLSIRLREALPPIMPLLAVFLAGAVATAAGVVTALWAVDGPTTLGTSYDALGSVVVAAFTGGAANIDAVAATYGVAQGNALYGTVQAILPAVVSLWMMAALIVPRLLMPLWPRKLLAASHSRTRPAGAGVTSEAEAVHAVHFGLVLAMGLGAVWLTEMAAAWLAGWGVAFPSVLIVAALALALGQVRAVARLQGADLLGTFAVYLFLAVLGAHCDVAALASLDSRGTTLLIVALIVLAVHGVVSVAAARWMRADPAVAAVASQANVGNAAAALALARGLGRPDLLVAAVLAGALGAIGGTFIGVWTAAHLLPLLGA